MESGKKPQYYCGQTDNLENRLEEHNRGESISTRWGIPWKVIHTEAFSTRAEAIQKETWIKKRGMKRYMEDLQKG